MNESALANPVTLIGCVVTANTAGDGGGVAGAGGTLATLKNCIVWGNSDAGGTHRPAQLKGPGDHEVFYSCVQNLLTAPPGEDPIDPAAFPGSIESDPLFLDVNGADNILGTSDDDPRLSGGSPCIDAGDNTAVPAASTQDILGNPRFRDDPATADSGKGTAPIVDMGAYEFVGTTTASLVIDAGAASTASTDTTLDLGLVNGAAVTQMRFSDDGIRWSVWQPFASSASRTILAIDGTRLVFGQFADAGGVILASAVDSIVLDRRVIQVCALDQGVSMDASCLASLPDLTGDLVFVGNAAIVSVTQTPAAGTSMAPGESLLVTFEAVDEAGNIGVCTATVTAQDTTAPVITTCVANQTVAGGASGFGSMPDLRAELVVDDQCPGTLTITQNPRAGTILPNNFTFPATFTVTDAAGNAAQCSAMITVGSANVAPVLNAIADQSVEEGSLLSLTVTATDADLPVQTLTFSLGSGAPAGASITAGGTFIWTPTGAQSPSTNGITVIVTDDGTPALSDTNGFLVVVLQLPLVLQSSGIGTGMYDSEYEANIDEFNRTIVTTLGGDVGFYRLRAQNALRIVNMRINEPLIVIDYEPVPGSAGLTGPEQ